MQGFIRRKNIEHYRKLLAGKLEASERELITSLLAEEEAKKLPPGRAETLAKPSGS